ncbi:MAG: MFS transporter [Gammaproteobacteria bacterium]
MQRLQAMRYSTDPKTDASLRHSVRDGAAYSLMAGSGESYFTAFAVFLKASTAQISFLASVPPLIAAFAQLLSAWLGHRTGQRKKIILGGALLQALVWAPMAILPLYFHEYAVEVFICCVILFYAFGNLVAPQWSSLMGELVAEKKRGRYFARRTRISSMMSFVALVAAGVVLHSFDQSASAQPGFLLIFGFALLARLVSVYHLSRMHDPAGHVAALEVRMDKLFWQPLRHSTLSRFALFFSLMQFSVAVASPFFSVYLLRDLGFTYLEFMSLSAATVLLQFLTLSYWGRIADIFGNRIILLACGSLIPLMPLLWLLSSNFYYLLCTQAFGGVIWAGFTLSSGNYLYDLIPSRKRASLMAFHNVAASIGIFLGALLGGVLGSILPADFSLLGWSQHWSSPLYHVFIASCMLRGLTALYFLPRLTETRRVKATTIRRLIFRVARFNPLTGLIFDVVGSRKKPAATSTPRHRE